MDNVSAIIVSALVSGMLATIITLLWQSYSQKRSIENDIFKTLMSYRFRIAEYENVKALNAVQVIFSKNKAVQRAWKSFMEEANRMSFNNQKIDDAYIKLLEIIGQACGYKSIKWDDIKESYLPIALSNEILENERLRKANLQRAEIDLSNQQSESATVFPKL